MGDDDLDLIHAGHYRGMTTDITPDLSRDGRAADRVPPGGRATASRSGAA